MLDTEQSPKWSNAERKSCLVALFERSQGFCIFGHRPCKGEAKTETIKVCAWGYFCNEPMPDGEPCRYNPEDNKPRLPCNIFRFVRYRWYCAFGEPCHKPFGSHYDNYADSLITEWKADDRATIEALWKAERLSIHRLGERRYPVRGRFSNIAKDIYYAEQPQFYLIGLSISGLTFKPFAQVRLPSSYLHLFVSLGDTLKTLSKNKRRKAIRYSKALPKDIEDSVNAIIRQAVEDFFSFSH